MLRRLLTSPRARPVIMMVLVSCLAVLARMELLPGISISLGDRDTLARWTSALSGAERQAIPVTVLDVDDETLARLGKPDRVPRALVAGLLALAGSKKPLGLFVDLDMSRPGPQPEADEALRQFVARYPAEAPPIGFASRFVAAAAGAPATALGLAPLPSILDPAMAGKPNIWPISSIALPDDDQVIRRWTLTQTLCAGRTGTTFASPQLLAAASAEAPGAAAALLKPFLEAETAARCATAGAPPLWPRNPEPRATVWFLAGGERGDAAMRMTERAGAVLPVVQRVPVHALLGADGALVNPRLVSEALFRNRFVIIGATHADSFDAHMTPAGQMPGAIITANIIATAPATLSAMAVPPALHGVLALAIFAILALLTRKLRALVAGAVAIGILLVVLALLGRMVAPTTALDIVLSATALIALYSGLESLLEIAKGVRQGEGWQALLKPAARKPKVP